MNNCAMRTTDTIREVMSPYRTVHLKAELVGCWLMFIQISLGQEGQGQCVMRAVGMGGTIREALRAGHGGCLA